MRLDFFLLADSAAVEAPGGKITIKGGGVSHVSGATLPVVVPHLDAVARLIIEPGDTGRDHIIGFRITSPSGESIASVNGSLRPELAEGNEPAHPGEEQGFVVIAGMARLEFPEFGIYPVDFEIDGEPILSRGLSVVEGPESSEPADS